MSSPGEYALDDVKGSFTACSPKSEPVSQVGLKHDAGKLRMDLLPGYPLMRLAEVYTIGAAKYADDNWRNGISYKRIFAALLRHAWKWFMREKFDPADGQHHLASVAWCAFTLMEYEVTRSEFDDRPVGATHNDVMPGPKPLPLASGTASATVANAPVDRAEYNTSKLRFIPSASPTYTYSR